MGLKICYLVVKKLPNPLFDIVFFINIPNLEFNYQKIIKNQKSNRKFTIKYETNTIFSIFCVLFFFLTRNVHFVNFCQNILIFLLRII